MITEAVILAGGFGTRLKNVIHDIPKPMAPINDIPFLSYLLEMVISSGVEKIIISVGYKSEVIVNYFGYSYKGVPITYTHEVKPLGTGGGIKFAIKEVNSQYFFVLNGDTLFDVDLQELGKYAIQKKSDIAIALKQLYEFDRYGSIEINNNFEIVEFQEKRYKDIAFINGGIYCINKNIFTNIKEEKFSFEQDVLERIYKSSKVYGKVFDCYFIDIGIPKDYFQAQDDFKRFKH